MHHLSPLLASIDQLVSQAKRRYCVYYLWRSFPFLILFSGCAYLLCQSVAITILVTGLAIGLVFLKLNRTSTWHKFTRENILLFWNFHYPALQQSAQLLTAIPPAGALLPRLQQQKVFTILEQLISQNDPQLLPLYPFKPSLCRSLVMLLVVVSMIIIDPIARIFNTDDAIAISQRHQPQLGANGELTAKIRITPPPYTGEKPFTQSNLDLAIISGSDVEWQLTSNQQQAHYRLFFADGTAHDFLPKQSNQHTLRMPISHSSVYYIATDKSIDPQLHSIAVTQDQPPQVRILTPTATTTGFNMDTHPNATIVDTHSNAHIVDTHPKMSTQVRVTDDFGISKVDILASVAKGSGEAVKFRDQVFTFDSQTQQDDVLLLNKTWYAKELGMEPGDELYFTVRVWDNRQPQAQLTRSKTKIFRWLDDQDAQLISEGILIDFMPEYFKSQRQIIIETQQLIADKTILSASQFEQTSRSLGHSQNDLKLKYGQYLGDEFDDGSGGHAMEQDPGNPEIHTKDGDHGGHDTDDEDAPQTAAGSLTLDKSPEPNSQHHHDEASADSDSVDKSGRQQLIQQYGHNHPDADVGLIGSQSPVAIMKRAIANMWDAELHLMLAQPERALPFEIEALKYLNKARTAERVYVKRLGFEPPPVTEERRYQGDLSDVLSYQQQQASQLPVQELEDLSQLLALLNTINTNSNAMSLPEREINPQQLAMLTRIKERWMEMAQTRPALIKHVTSLQRMQITKRVALPQCSSCVTSLYNELWRQLPNPIAVPYAPRPLYSTQNSAVEGYLEFLQSLQHKGQP